MQVFIHSIMLKFVVILFGVVAALSEEQEHKLQATKNEVLSGLQKVASGDSTRKILLQSALKTVSDLGATLSPNENEKLTNVSNLLDDLLTTFENEATARSGYVNGLTASMGSCDVQNAAEIAALEANVTSLLAAHIQCRAQHHEIYQQKMSRYTAIITWMSRVAAHHNTHEITWTASLENSSHTVSGEDSTTAHTVQTLDLANACSQPRGNTGGEGGGYEDDIISGAYERFFETTTQWFDEMYVEFVSVANMYTNAATVNSNKETACDNAQRWYEEETCSYATYYDSTCSARAACWAGLTSSNTYANIDSFLEDNENVPELARLIMYVQCIIGEIQLNVTETTADARETCAWWMTAPFAPTPQHVNYSMYYIDVSSLINGNGDWPTASDCAQARFNALDAYLPFTFSSGASTSYRDAIVAHAEYNTNTSENTAPDYWGTMTNMIISNPTCNNVDPAR